MALRQKTCKVCRNKFTPSRPLEAWCSFDCAIALAERRRMKEAQQDIAAARKEARQRLESMKGIPELIRDADRAFCAFIRARDKAAGHPCISSGLPLDWSGNNVDAGHYRSRGAASHIRYDERNCHAQAKRENRYKGGNVVEYRKRLIERIGLEAVEALEADNRTHKWTRDELVAIRRHYTAKLKETQKA